MMCLDARKLKSKKLLKKVIYIYYEKKKPNFFFFFFIFIFHFFLWYFRKKRFTLNIYIKQYKRLCIDNIYTCVCVCVSRVCIFWAAEIARAHMLVFVDRNGTERGLIATDGIVTVQEQKVAIIDADSLQAGTIDESLIGYISNKLGCSVLDADDTEVASVDLGRMSISENGSVIAEISSAGEISNHAGSYVGRIDGFSFNDMRVAALYLVLIDRDFFRQ
jgi:hypothetical protein